MALLRQMMCPRFNLIYEETPHELLYQERKTSLGEGCLSEQTDQNEWARSRRTETHSSLARTVKMVLFSGCFSSYFPPNDHVPAPCLCLLYIVQSLVPPAKTIHWRSHSLSFPWSLPLSFTLLSGPLLLSTAHFCCASVLLYSAAYRTFSHAASIPPSLPPKLSDSRVCFKAMLVRASSLWPVHLNIDCSITA